jgi:hypothetical protein
MKRGLFIVPIKNRYLATTTGGSREDALGSAGGYKLQAASCKLQAATTVTAEAIGNERWGL